MERLKGKIALITGSFQGIGEAISLAFAMEGASVILVDKQPISVAEDLLRKIRGLGAEGIALQADISRDSEVSRFVEASLAKFGQIDILVNNAGIGQSELFENITEEIWDNIIDVNLKGVFLCCKHVGNQMIKRKKGNIINISSLLSVIVLPGRAAYSASKAGVVALTKALAVEWAKYHIRANAIGPVATRTEFIGKLISQGKLSEEDLVKNVPMGRLAEPNDIASAAVFLGSEESSLITGQNLLVDGGYSLL